MTQRLQSAADHFGLAWRGLRGASSARPNIAGKAVRVEELPFTQVPADVSALFVGLSGQSMQYGHAWFENFAQHVATADQQARLFVLRREGVATVALPVFLMGRDGGPVQRVEALSNYYTAVFAPALSESADATDMAVVLRAILRQYPKVASMRFSPMDTGHKAYSMMKDALAHCGLLAFPFFAFGNWYRVVTNVRWSTLRSSLKSRLRNTLSRLGKKFAADGGQLEIVTGGDRLEVALDAYLTVYAGSWKQTEPYPGFMPGLVRTCAKRGWLRLGVAWLGETPIAAQVWIVAQDRAEIFKVAYDERYGQYSIGSLLTAALLEQALDADQVHEVDYLIGDDAYKKEWVDQRRERWGLIVYNPRTLGGLLGVCRESAGRILKLLKLRPA